MTTPVDRLTAALAGRYEIEREIGQGGMATVYLARDLRHQRKVALKVLRPELSAILGSERFLHEIRTTANLQHPHILPLHDSGEADGMVFYVMPFVQGESLRDRLSRETQLPVDDAVCIAREVADALDYAHRHGVIHRDIKPENILLHDGRAQVADFGIALAVSSAGGGTRMTETGMSLGTPHYMSPEQAMGEREISGKADIYALGCVLYEMLVGEPPFTGPSAQAIIARVVTEEPRSMAAQRRSVSPELEAVVRRALEKLPADRFQSAAQFGSALSNPEAVPLVARRERAGVTRPTTPAAVWRSRATVPAMLVLLLVSMVAAVWGWMRPRPVVPRPVVRFALTLPENAGYAETGGQTITMSPSGDRFAYTGRNERGEAYIYLRRMDAAESVPVPGSRGATQPFFSPDGAWLGFFLDEKIQKVAVSGGPVLSVAAADSSVIGATWGAGDVIVVGTLNGLRQVPAAGGRLTVLTVPDPTRDNAHRFPDFLPDGKTVLFQIRDKEGIDRLGAVDLERATIKRFAEAGANPRYVESGHVLLASLAGAIVAAPFDASRVEVIGPSIPVVDGVTVGTAGAAKFGVSRDGSLVYATGSSLVRSVVLVDRKGAVTPLTTELRGYGSPRFSPDGQSIALDIADASASSIWIFAPRQKTLTRLTFDGAETRPFWTPDGSRVTYTVRGDNPSIAWARADGSDSPAAVHSRAREAVFGDDWSRDGRTLLFHQLGGADRANDIMRMSLDSGSAPVPFIGTRANEGGPVVAPDGRWVAYFSDESGRQEIYVRSFPNPSAKIQVSLAGGSEPRWSRDGRELFYRLGDQMWVAQVRTQPTFSVIGRTELFRGRFPAVPFFAQYDPAPDGSHFVMVQGPTASPHLTVVLNWFDQLHGTRAAATAAGQ